MTKEQETIENIKIYIHDWINESVDEDGYERYAIEEYDKEFMNDIETVLNMLKEKDKKIESLEKTLDKRFIYVTGARKVYGRLMQLDKESIVQDDLKRRNELNQCIKAEEKYKELYHKALRDLAKADRENIQLKKQIDLMSEELIGVPIDNNNLDWEHPYRREDFIFLDSKEEVKQYFERKATNNA